MEKSFLEECLGQALSLDAIGELVGRHPSTVSYWLKKHGLEAGGAEQHAPKGRVAPGVVRQMVEDGKSIREIAEELGAGYSKILVEEAGGCCRLCGFKEHQAALQFHHMDPSEKTFHLAHGGMTRGIEHMREEAQKCMLLCANCHALIEAGVKEVPTGDR